jgi:DNA-binding NtrC family response regulator
LVRPSPATRCGIADIDKTGRTGGNKLKASQLLGLDRKTLYRKLEEYQAEDAATL